MANVEIKVKLPNKYASIRYSLLSYENKCEMEKPIELGNSWFSAKSI